MLWWFAETTLIASGLAVLATLGGRWKRLGPEARHGLWLLVLIKLAMPPVVAWPWALPGGWPAPVESGAAVVGEARRLIPKIPAAELAKTSPLDADLAPSPELRMVPGSEIGSDAVDLADEDDIVVPDTPLSVPAPEPAEAPAAVVVEPTRPEASDRPGWGWRMALVSAWLAGSVVVVARRGVKVARFHRVVAGAPEAPGWLVEESRAIGERVGVRSPGVVATPRVATPLLWCLGRPVLVLPDALIRRLGVDRWPGILAHELAHLARGDHWVVRLELLVEAVWWWNPLFWLARRRLHEQAELACDARVVRSWPDRRHAYAEALVDVCEHIARSAIPSPSLGVGGAGAAHSLEGRLSMILRGPIPRRPTRRLAALAALMAALALPSWTLGQQPPKPAGPDAPASKPEAPPSKPEETAAAKPSPEPPPQAVASLATIEAIRAAREQAGQGIESLSFRYVVAGRDQNRIIIRHEDNKPVTSMSRTSFVQAADVILARDGSSRLDVLEIRPRGSVPGQSSASPWSRRLVAFDGSSYLTLESARDNTGPVPFRLLGVSGRQTYFGDSLTMAFRNTNQFEVVPDRGIDPLDPRPRNLLDLGDISTPFLNPELSRVEVVGRDTIDGREAVRVAWTSKANDGLRGLCWFQGMNLIRSDATMDPDPSASNRRKSWRKRSEGYTQVANLWLPRQVIYEETEADPAGGEPFVRRERRITIEDYRVGPNPPAETFHPKLAIQDLDETSGKFTTAPPEVPAGLIARLGKAVAESPFGPPGVAKAAEEPRVGASSPLPSPVPAPSPSPNPLADVLRLIVPDPAPQGVGPGLPPPTSRAPQGPRPAITPPPPPPADDPARGDPGIIAPARGITDPMPTVDPATNDPISPRPLAARPVGNAEVDLRAQDETEIRREVERRFRIDPEVAELRNQLTDAKLKLERSRRITSQPNDPSLAAAKRKLDQLQSSWERLWVSKSETIRDQLPSQAQARDQVEILQARRDGKLAEVKKAEALRGLAQAVVRRNETLKAKNANFVSNEEMVKAEGELAVAEAEVAGKKAELAEAGARLKQAARIADPTFGNAPTDKPDDVALPPPNPGDGTASRQARRDAKAAEVQKAEAQLSLAQTEVKYVETLVAKRGVSAKELALYEGKRAIAEAEVAGKKAELAEAEALLNQAGRRVPSAAPVPSPTPSSSTLADLRDAVEVMEAQLRGKQAELRGEDLKVARLKTHLDDMKKAGLELQPEYRDAKADIQAAEVAREVKQAEVAEFEVRLQQARRRASAGEARIRREANRARTRLNETETSFKKGGVPRSAYETDKASYDELMLQLDPKFTPALEASRPGDR